MADDYPFEILVTESKYILRAEIAPPPPNCPPYQLDFDRQPVDICYINIGSFYTALCGGAPLAMIARISDQIRMFRRTGPAKYKIIEMHERDKYRFCLGDVYICYSQCVLVMFEFFLQIAQVLDPTANVSSLHNKQVCDEDMHATMYWIQNLEWSTRLTAAKLAGQKLQRNTSLHCYNSLAMPYAYLLYTQHLMHTTIKKSHHCLGKRRLVPMLALMLEGYVLYNSSLKEEFKTYRSTSMQTMLMLKLNQDLLQRANELGEQLIQEEEADKQKMQRKLKRNQMKRQKKKAERQRCKKALEAAQDHCVPTSDDVSPIEGEEGDSDTDSVIIIMDAEYPEWLKAMHRLYAKPDAYKHNISFIEKERCEI